mmetsp:Transcript_23646/g.37209  ORF Transcript_23646/g.37209 Transcript_23646/m.37209 type:complete len:222 (-) Transcript_23646:134-799(-)
MGLVSPLVGLLTAAGQWLAVYSTYTWGVEPHVLDPVLTKALGRWTFLTYQSNIILTIYFTVSFINSIVSFDLVDCLLVSMFPLVFALGVFLTTAYYALDHFNPLQQKRREHFAKNGYPMIWVDAHLEHCMALPLIIIFITYTELENIGDMRPEFGWTMFSVGGYSFYYLLQVHYVFFVSGLWVYPIIAEISSKGGIQGRNIFFAGLMCVFLVLGTIGSVVM